MIEKTYSEIAYIYILYDERNPDIVRYVGKTISPKKRLISHINEAKYSKNSNYKINWIRSILRDNLEPKMKLIKICNLDEYIQYETHYIKLYMSEHLTNSDLTGTGYTRKRYNHEKIKVKLKKVKAKEVYCFDLDGKFLKKYDSIRDASNVLNISHANISRCCNGKFKHSGGYIFRYELKNVSMVENPNSIKKIVAEVDKDGNILQKWNSISECSKDVGIDNSNISRVCNGKLRKIKGRFFVFSY